jgi:hypothetical protein
VEEESLDGSDRRPCEIRIGEKEAKRMDILGFDCRAEERAVLYLGKEIWKYQRREV